jgi:hypothetical protein
MAIEVLSQHLSRGTEETREVITDIKIRRKFMLGDWTDMYLAGYFA